MGVQNAVVFDLESVPDLTAGRAVLGAAPDVPDEEVRRRLGEKYARPNENPETAFVKVSMQKIVCIGAVYAERIDGGHWSVVRSGVGHVGVRTEGQLITSFIDSLNTTPSPVLVGFHSSGFDLPLLRYRALALSVPARPLHGGNGRDYWYRYGRDHIDLCDVMSNFGASARPSLTEVAALCGAPAKIGGIDGSKVEPMVLQGRIEEVAAYCETDIFATYLVFLRYLLTIGQLSAEDHTQSIAALRGYLADRVPKRPHLGVYLDALKAPDAPVLIEAGVEQREAS